MPTVARCRKAAAHAHSFIQFLSFIDNPSSTLASFSVFSGQPSIGSARLMLSVLTIGKPPYRLRVRWAVLLFHLFDFY